MFSSSPIISLDFSFYRPCALFQHRGVNFQKTHHAESRVIIHREDIFSKKNTFFHYCTWRALTIDLNHEGMRPLKNRTLFTTRHSNLRHHLSVPREGALKVHKLDIKTRRNKHGR